MDSEPVSQDLPAARLIGPPQVVFDDARVTAEIARIVNDLPRDDWRGALVAVLKDQQDKGRAAIADFLAENPEAARRTIRSYAYLTDRLVKMTIGFVQTHLYPLSVPTKSERLAVMAVGGYGRGEMAPYSDVDLLFLVPDKITPWAESVIEASLYILWDLKLKVGHASRTLNDCVRLGRDDHTIRTALLESRYLLGDADLAARLRQRLSEELFKGTAQDFIEAKMDERRQRHKRQGGQRYMLEPNVKEGKGGLRDLQSLYWIAKYVYGVEDTDDLVKVGLLQPEEYKSFEDSERFLWAVRCHLHILSKRPMEQLSFDRQIEVAERMGYRDSAAQRGVEHFMQDYFRHATMVGDLTRIFLTALEGQHVRSAPSFLGFLRRNAQSVALPDGYTIRNGRLDIDDPDTFFDTPINLLRLFTVALDTGYLIHPNAMRLVAARLDLVDDLRSNPDAVEIFLGLMLDYGNPERALRRMNELGVLGRFIPEFDKIVAMMQFNVYHHYTVDEHIIQCIAQLAKIEHEELIEELPLSSGILKRGVDRRVLYVALLLHDIGKGRKEDHSIVGARIARRVTAELGFSPEDSATIEWLVRYHLLMSDVAQKRDLSDPRTVRDFAKAVKTKDRLDLLTVLTVCDIRGVGPGTWNNWKAQLIRNLYRQTREAMENGLEDLNRDKREAEAKSALEAALTAWSADEIAQEVDRHYGPYWQGLPTETHVAFAHLLHGITADELRIDLWPDRDRDVTRVAFAMADHPGIFARLAGALALAGANVVDARTFTTRDGFVTDAFWIQDNDGQPYEESHLPRLRRTIEKILKGEVVTRDALESRDKLKKRERGFRFPTHIDFDNEASEIYTVIEVDTRDRPGLLFDLAKTLADANIYISSAVIATYGAQVVDTFYVKDMFGLKFHSKAKQDAIESRLRSAIQHGTERAMSS